MLSDALKKTIQGAYSQFLDANELKARYGQKLMIAEIARTLGKLDPEQDSADARPGDHICVVEAGTGTGKTVAYLLATIPIAQALKKKLVISTATVALQEQVVNKDLPQIRRQSGLEFSFALAKGRGRYLCLSKMDRILTDGDSPAAGAPGLYADEIPLVSTEDVTYYQGMMDTMARGEWDGDRDSWSDGVDAERWSRVTTDHRQCTGRRCSNITACPFFKARDDIGKVDVIVTNHDMVMADLALGGGAILPDPAESIYVFDEGHHLPDKSLGHFAHHSRLLGSIRWLDQANKSLGQMLEAVGDAGSIERFAEQLPGTFLQLRQLLDQAWSLIKTETQLEHSPEFDKRYRFDNGIVPESIKSTAQALTQSFDQLADLLGKMVRELEDGLEDSQCSVPRVDLENWFPVVGGWLSRAQANLELWASYATPDAEGAPPRARWVSYVENGSYSDYEVCSSPILAARTLEHRLWNHCFGAVVTSATMTALGRFDRFMMRAGTPVAASYASVPSPFNFTEAAELHIPAGAVDAGKAQEHTAQLIRDIPELLTDSEASLVLFSSRRQMMEVYESLPSRWRELILLQDDYSKQKLLDMHRQRIDDSQGSVIFGLASFAEGIDLPGRYCAHVVIAKLPFSVPDDPVEASLAEWIEQRGGNPFMEITVPDASLRLIQACGRLLRTEQDTGKITLLDKRVITRRYGKAILSSLPPYRQMIGVV